MSLFRSIVERQLPRICERTHDMKFNRKAAALLMALTVGGGALLVPGIVSAQEGETPVAVAPSAPDAAVDEAPIEVDGDLDVDERDEFEDDWQPTPEELAEFNAETDELIAALTDAGIAVERMVDEDGFVYPEFDENMSEADIDKLDAILGELYGEELEVLEGEFDGEFAEFAEEIDVADLTEEEIAALNAETDKLAEELRSAGIDVEIHAEENGLNCIDFEEEELTEEQIAALDEFFNDLDGEGIEFELLEDEMDLDEDEDEDAGTEDADADADADAEDVVVG